MIELPKLCPCCSTQDYAHCCKPFHDGILPVNALQLMRSRYCAYALNFPDYILSTTHPNNPQYSKDKAAWRKSISQFSQNTSFIKLQIHDFKENDALATVTFTAYLSQNNLDATFTEKSNFEKVNGKWLYLDGNLVPGSAPKFLS